MNLQTYWKLWDVGFIVRNPCEVLNNGGGIILRIKELNAVIIGCDADFLILSPDGNMNWRAWHARHESDRFVTFDIPMTESVLQTARIEIRSGKCECDCCNRRVMPVVQSCHWLAHVENLTIHENSAFDITSRNQLLCGMTSNTCQIVALNILPHLHFAIHVIHAIQKVVLNHNEVFLALTDRCSNSRYTENETKC